MTCAVSLIAALPAKRVLGDKAYDANSFREQLAEWGMDAIIPSNRNRRVAIAYDKHIYKDRHLVECFINKIKHCRRVATRYDKTAQAFAAFVALASIMVWLR